MPFAEVHERFFAHRPEIPLRLVRGLACDPGSTSDRGGHGDAARASRLLLIIAAAYVHKRRERARASLNWTPASLAILVPAYNEAKVICNTIQALLASSDNQTFDIHVVDDGSTDGTADVARRGVSTAERVKIHTKPNGGKAAALNFALKLTDAEVIVAIDADTLLMPNAVDFLTRPFADPSEAPWRVQRGGRT